jgi:arginine/lysine/ornithine decarboxylase
MPKWLLQVVLLTLFCSSLIHVQSTHEIEEEIEDEINKSQFPKGFLFGTSTSSYQVLVQILYLLLKYV